MRRFGGSESGCNLREYHPAYTNAWNSMEWRLMGAGSDSLESLNVFGIKGDRFSIIVFQRDQLPPQYAEIKGRWALVCSGTGHCLFFSFQWAIDLQGSGCVLLCGRECSSISGQVTTLA